MKTDFEKELEIKESYDAMLDECYPPVKIGYATFTASEILFNCDPVMYHQGLLDYQDSIEEQRRVSLTNKGTCPHLLGALSTGVIKTLWINTLDFVSNITSNGLGFVGDI